MNHIHFTRTRRMPILEELSLIYSAICLSLCTDGQGKYPSLRLVLFALDFGDLFSPYQQCYGFDHDQDHQSRRRAKTVHFVTSSMAGVRLERHWYEHDDYAIYSRSL